MVLQLGDSLLVHRHQCRMSGSREENHCSLLSLSAWATRARSVMARTNTDASKRKLAFLHCSLSVISLLADLYTDISRLLATGISCDLPESGVVGPVLSLSLLCDEFMRFFFCALPSIRSRRLPSALSTKRPLPPVRAWGVVFRGDPERRRVLVERPVESRRQPRTDRETLKKRCNESPNEEKEGVQRSDKSVS